jgi:hypothetical protein
MTSIFRPKTGEERTGYRKTCIMRSFRMFKRTKLFAKQFKKSNQIGWVQSECTEDKKCKQNLGWRT